ncbi:unnamed protein product [Staurois parvus]|uniref:Uncharacterized protein n=1 Tax=Staurois parvus TaxID=386267 RepID=A0ABN9ADI5_9NEOB|nr:unnamed protein product [Staurois parvus]
MVRDCGQDRGDGKRLRTGGRSTLQRDLTCSSIQRRAVFPASVVWALGMTSGCQVRMRKKRCFL